MYPCSPCAFSARIQPSSLSAPTTRISSPSWKESSFRLYATYSKTAVDRDRLRVGAGEEPRGGGILRLDGPGPGESSPDREAARRRSA